MDLATTHDIRVVPFTPEQQRQAMERHGFYSALDLPAGIYRGVDEPVSTLSVWNVIICNADMPTDLIADLARVLFEQNEFMQRIHPFARYTTPENTVRYSPLPLHPGTIRYLEATGLAVPDRLIPEGGGDDPPHSE